MILLRGSSEHTGHVVDLRSVNGEALNTSGIAHAGALVDFAEAVLGMNDVRLLQARQNVERILGNAGLVDCAAVVAIFNAVVRIADATGIPLEAYKIDSTADLRAKLGIDGYPSAKS